MKRIKSKILLKQSFDVLNSHEPQVMQREVWREPETLFIPKQRFFCERHEKVSKTAGDHLIYEVDQGFKFWRSIQVKQDH